MKHVICQLKLPLPVVSPPQLSRPYLSTLYLDNGHHMHNNAVTFVACTLELLLPLLADWHGVCEVSWGDQPLPPRTCI